MKATKLLTRQHKEVKALLDQLPDAQGERRRELFEQVAANLAAHDAIERQIFYPAVEKAIGMDTILGEALVEHGVIEFMLYRTDRSLDGNEFEYEATVLRESVLHHAEEEEDELFSKVEKEMDEAELDELGEQMEQLFATKLEEGNFRQEIRSQLEQVLAGGMKTDEAKAAVKPRKRATSNGRSTKRPHAS